MKILVTGGAGYIGSHTIIDILENTDYDVISIDNYSNSDGSAYDSIERITGKTIKMYNVDLTDLRETKRVFDFNPDIIGVIHFAAHKSVNESVDDPLTYYHNNINSTINVLKCLNEFNVPYLIFSSSCSVYGNIQQLPVSEDTPMNTIESPYAYTKQICENMINNFVQSNSDIKAISLRYFNPVGAHKSGLNGERSSDQPNNLVPYITQTAIGKLDKLTIFGGDYDTPDGTCIRDYVHVCDIASAHIQAIKKISSQTFPNYSIINLGTGTGYSVLEIIDAFKRVSDINLKYTIGPRRAGDIKSIYADNTKAKTVLQWSPQYNIDDIMLSAWMWQKNNS